MLCSCGETFDVDEAASTFNAYFNEEYDYFYYGYEKTCADCAISNTEWT